MIFLLLKCFWEKRVEADRRGQQVRRRARNRLALEEALAGQHLSRHRAEGTDVRALVWFSPSAEYPFRKGARHLSRCDVLVEAEQVVRIVLSFDAGQTAEADIVVCCADVVTC